MLELQVQAPVTSTAGTRTFFRSSIAAKPRCWAWPCELKESQLHLRSELPCPGCVGHRVGKRMKRFPGAGEFPHFLTDLAVGGMRWNGWGNPTTWQHAKRCFPNDTRYPKIIGSPMRKQWMILGSPIWDILGTPCDAQSCPCSTLMLPIATRTASNR